VDTKLRRKTTKKDNSYINFDSFKSLPEIPAPDELEALTAAQNRELINYKLKLYTISEEKQSTC